MVDLQRLDFLPMTEEEADWTKPSDTEMLAWERADYLLDLCTLDELSEDIPLFYALGLHWGEVMNGGHSQFLANLQTRNRRWVLAACQKAAEKMYPPNLGECCRKLNEWVEQNPVDYEELTGFEGGMHEALDRLDEIVIEADVNSGDYLRELISKSSDTFEPAFVESILNETASDNSHLNAMRTIWLKRGGLVRVLSDEEVDDIFDDLVERQQNRE